MRPPLGFMREVYAEVYAVAHRCGKKLAENIFGPKLFRPKSFRPKKFRSKLFSVEKTLTEKVLAEKCFGRFFLRPEITRVRT